VCRVLSRRGALQKGSHYADPAGGVQQKSTAELNFLRYILNIVKYIQDYYAPLIGEFEQVVLLSLLRLGNGTWGAAIRRDIQERIVRDLPVSVVYVTLQRMERKGFVKSYVGEPTKERGGRRRRHYLIDTAGEQALGRSFRSLKKMAEGLEQRLETL
jgi:DNA-binding PadR family transcriptional regulator